LEFYFWVIPAALALRGTPTWENNGDAILVVVLGVLPLHDIAMTNSVRCIADKGGVGGGAYIAQYSCNRIAIGSGLLMMGGNEKMIDYNKTALK